LAHIDLPIYHRSLSFKLSSNCSCFSFSGKSTLVQALFRLLEAEEGCITIGGIDISTLGLHALRTGMSVIPQMPTLFSGCTIRENLDPFAAFSDDSIYEALRDAHMLKTIQEQPSGLDAIVAEGGSNFSVGQRQLLCLARAILRKAKILVLDEATANVDTRTDHLLQEAVARSFHGATIIAVAHRLDTVIDYDKILVLGNGEVLAFDTPEKLASEEGSVFSSMIDDTGRGMATELRRRASRSSLVDIKE
jgi:ABC-type multidrug transport system fused ATPase/permease subunit